jgi:hypothetical protein
MLLLFQIFQYFWLERFHEHVERQHQHEEMTGGTHGQDREPEISRSMPTHYESAAAAAAAAAAPRTTETAAENSKDNHTASSIV